MFVASRDDVVFLEDERIGGSQSNTQRQGRPAQGIVPLFDVCAMRLINQLDGYKVRVSRSFHYPARSASYIIVVDASGHSSLFLPYAPLAQY